MSGKRPPAFPTREEVLDWLAGQEGHAGKREIARAFGITDAEGKMKLKKLLRELKEGGAVERGHRRKVGAPGSLPHVTTLVITGPDPDGELLARPETWAGEGRPPRIFMAPEQRGHALLVAGDRVLARLARVEDEYEARMIHKLDAGPQELIGIYERGRIEPVDKRDRNTYQVAEHDRGGAEPGDLVAAGLLSGRRASIRQVLGHRDDPGCFSLIAIHRAGIPVPFPPGALQDAQGQDVPPLGQRTDLRHLPLVTIDGADARDYDDAVHAEPAGEGWRLLVAIADVAHYVRPGTALDRAAQERGNSVYFPDRVVPMLPEVLSNGLCSLMPGEDRACMAFWLNIDKRGELTGWKLVRGLMRSAARLTYEQVQAARDGAPDALTGPLMEKVITPLYAAFACLAEARGRRGALELDLKENKIRLDDKGQVADISPRPRLDSHKLIEEFMIAANVAAAAALEEKGHPCIYRVHDEPDPERLDKARDYLDGLGLRLVRSPAVRPAQLNQILKLADETPFAKIAHETVLRAQAQAVYDPENRGHFGLALGRYAHFTSPIRRYADLVVHRSLIAAYGLGPDGLSDEQRKGLVEIAGHISRTERRAVEAERDANDRYLASWLASKVGQEFKGRISGVTRFGLFIALDGSGADGLVPIRSLPDDFYDHQESQHALIGRRWGRIFRLGAPVRVKLKEADPLTGSSILELLDEEAELPGYTPPAGTALPVRRQGPRRPGGPPRKGGPGGKRPGPGRKHGKGGKAGGKGGKGGKRRS